MRNFLHYGFCFIIDLKKYCSTILSQLFKFFMSPQILCPRQVPHLPHSSPSPARLQISDSAYTNCVSGNGFVNQTGQSKSHIPQNIMFGSKLAKRYLGHRY